MVGYLPVSVYVAPSPALLASCVISVMLIPAAARASLSLEDVTGKPVITSPMLWVTKGILAILACAPKIASAKFH